MWIDHKKLVVLLNHLFNNYDNVIQLLHASSLTISPHSIKINDST